MFSYGDTQCFLNETRGNSDITMQIPSFSIEQKQLTDSWMELAPIVTDIQTQEYRKVVTMEKLRMDQQAQQEFWQFQQEFQNTPRNQVF